jgi:lipocalin
MKKIKLLGFLGILALMLASSSAQARPNNYIDANNHLWVWYNGAYMDMGVYHP